MASKKDLSERDICTKYIIPALKKAGWDIQTQIREENSSKINSQTLMQAVLKEAFEK